MSKQRARKPGRKYKSKPIPGEPETPVMDKVRNRHQKRPGGHWRYLKTLMSRRANGLATKGEIKTLDAYFAESAAINAYHFPRHDPDEDVPEGASQ